ncbi:MAG: hypothetical protein V2A73_02630 [Pseudomonadota bacterium]
MSDRDIFASNHESPVWARLVAAVEKLLAQVEELLLDVIAELEDVGTKALATLAALVSQEQIGKVGNSCQPSGHCSRHCSP